MFSGVPTDRSKYRGRVENTRHPPLEHIDQLSINQFKLHMALGWVLGVVNRPSVAGAVLKTPLQLTNSLSRSESSRHYLSQTVRVGELKF